MESSNVLHIKYRPQSFDTVLGQDACVKSLKGIIKRNGAHTFLFSGPSGVGKTTLARIVAQELGTAPNDIMDVDAATFTGVEAMRQITDSTKYLGFGEAGIKSIVVDEAHGLSRQAWQSLLKATEEPPSHIYWFFCTTELSKVPKTIKTRSASYVLKEVNDKTLGVLFDRVCAKEKFDVSGEVGDIIIAEAGGSPRQMLVNLALCENVTSAKEARTILRQAHASDPIIEICRFLVKGGSWTKIMDLVTKLDEENPESVRIVVVNYVAVVLKNAKSDKEAMRLLHIIDQFAEPYNVSDKLAPLLLSIGRSLFTSGE